MPPHKPTLKELIESTPGLPTEAIQKRLALIAKSKVYSASYKEVVSAFLKEKLEAKRAAETNET